MRTRPGVEETRARASSSLWLNRAISSSRSDGSTSIIGPLGKADGVRIGDGVGWSGGPVGCFSESAVMETQIDMRLVDGDASTECAGHLSPTWGPDLLADEVARAGTLRAACRS